MARAQSPSLTTSTYSAACLKLDPWATRSTSHPCPPRGPAHGPRSRLGGCRPTSAIRQIRAFGPLPVRGPWLDCRVDLL